MPSLFSHRGLLACLLARKPSQPRIKRRRRKCAERENGLYKADRSLKSPTNTLSKCPGSYRFSLLGNLKGLVLDVKHRPPPLADSSSSWCIEPGRGLAACTCSRFARPRSRMDSLGTNDQPRHSCSISGLGYNHGTCVRNHRKSSKSVHGCCHRNHRHRRIHHFHSHCCYNHQPLGSYGQCVQL